MPGNPLEQLATCARIASDQYGVLSRDQLRAAGVSKDAIYRLTSTGALKRIRPAVYALWIPRSPAELWHHRLTAARFWLGDSAAVSHRAGAMVWDLDGIDLAPLEFSTTGGRRPSGPDLVLHRVRSLPASDITIHKNVRVTTLPRTIVDLATVAQPVALELALESALRTGSVAIDEIRAVLDRAGPTHRGRRALRRLLEEHPGTPTESALETLTWQLLRSGGLPVPVRQYQVHDELGNRVGRLDFAFVEERLAVEADGYRSHSKPRDWKRDRGRQNALTKLGWTVYRVTWEDVTRRGANVIADIRLLLRGRPQRGEAV